MCEAVDIWSLRCSKTCWAYQSTKVKDNKCPESQHFCPELIKQDVDPEALRRFELPSWLEAPPCIIYGILGGKLLRWTQHPGSSNCEKTILWFYSFTLSKIISSFLTWSSLSMIAQREPIDNFEICSFSKLWGEKTRWIFSAFFIYDRPESPMIPMDQIMLLYEFLIADSCWNSVELISHCIF